jgi:hypothetical protein
MKYEMEQRFQSAASALNQRYLLEKSSSSPADYADVDDFADFVNSTS